MGAKANGLAERYVMRERLRSGNGAVWAPPEQSVSPVTEPQSLKLLASQYKGTKWKRPVSKATAVALAVQGVLSEEQLATFVMTKQGFIPAVRSELAMLAAQRLLPDGHLVQYIKGDPQFVKAMGRAVKKLMVIAAMEGDYETAAALAKRLP
jgi:hypothetical protein